jgi:selenide,water dikinase
VTGFGLIAHLRGMLGSSADAQLEYAAIPVLDEAVDLAGAGIFPGGSRRNRDAMKQHVDAGELSEESQAILYDAQTSGGLLIAIDPDRTADLLTRLREGGNEWAATIGRTGPGSARVVVR